MTIFDALIAVGKVTVHRDEAGRPNGLKLCDTATPDEAASLAGELWKATTQENASQRFLIGDLFNSIEAGSSLRKAQIVNQLSSVLGGDYNTVRKFGHVAGAFPATESFGDGSPVRRFDVGWSALQEIASQALPVERKRELLELCRDDRPGKLTIQQLREATREYKPPRVSPKSRAMDLRNAALTVGQQDTFQFETPVSDSNFVMQPDLQERLDIAQKRNSEGEIVNLSLIGEASAGKSHATREMAARNNRPFFDFNCAMVTQASKWWGSREIANGATFFRSSMLVAALQTPNLVLLLDEVNRAEAHLLNPLLGLLDDRRETVTEDGVRIRVAPGVLIVATANYGASYVGTFEMDKAIRDRFPNECLVRLPSSQVVQDVLVNRVGCTLSAARLLAKAFAKVNALNSEYRVSMRAIQEAGKQIKYGMELVDAITDFMIKPCARYYPEDLRTVATCLQGTTGFIFDINALRS